MHNHQITPPILKERDQHPVTICLWVSSFDHAVGGAQFRQVQPVSRRATSPLVPLAAPGLAGQPWEQRQERLVEEEQWVLGFGFSDSCRSEGYSL